MSWIQKTIGRGVLVLLGLSSACSSTTAPEEHELALARQRWTLSNVRSYDYVGRVLCGECGPGVTRPVAVTVTNGVVTGRVFADTGEPISAETTRFATVESLFALIDSAYVRHAAIVNAVYDPGTGVPLRVFIDGSLQAIDDEVEYVVTGFRAR